MTELRVPANNFRKAEQRFRFLLWGSVAALCFIVLYAFAQSRSASPQLSNLLVWLVGAIAAAAIITAYVFAFWKGWAVAKRNLVFTLTDQELIRRKVGYPEIHIAFSEIKALHDGRGWLVVESVEPRRQIAIPKRVQGFSALRAELEKHAREVRPIRIRSSWIDLVLTVSYALGCAWMMWSKDAVVASRAGAVALVSLVWFSISMARLLRRSKKPLLLWIWLGWAWLGAAALVFFRVLRH
jgi:hypothetical protein